MMISEAFSILGIPIAQNVTVIKEAYQKLLPQYHPEEDPEGFMQLHKAYKTALSFAQGNIKPSETFARTTWQMPVSSEPSEEETCFNRMFADLMEEQPPVDIKKQKKAFFWKLLWLKLQWLPIPLWCWVKIFNDKDFLSCRKDTESMEKLFELLLIKVHPYHVFRFLINQLWELNNWQQSEGSPALAVKTQLCIAKLQKQYKPYLKWDPSGKSHYRILPFLWYYHALPFYFKMGITVFLLPAISFGSNSGLLLLLAVFYLSEIPEAIHKFVCDLGFFYPVIYDNKLLERFNIRGNGPLLLVIGFFSLLVHFGLTAAVFVTFYE